MPLTVNNAILLLRTNLCLFGIFLIYINYNERPLWSAVFIHSTKYINIHDLKDAKEFRYLISYYKILNQKICQ